MIRTLVHVKGTFMKKALILSLFLAVLATTGATCKKEEAPPIPQDSASAEGAAAEGETGAAAAPANDEGGMGEAADVKDNGQTHED